MSLRISGRNMNLGEALTARIEDRIEASVGKYFDGGHTGHVTVEKQGSFFEADCMVHLDTGIVLQASAKAGDATSAFEGAAERIDKRLRRYKRRLRDHHGRHKEQEAIEASLTVMEEPDQDEEVAEDYAPVVVAESATSVRTQTVAMAVMQLDMMDEPVNVFRNAATGAVNVVYRRADGNVGWIDPSPVNDALANGGMKREH